MRYRAYSEYKDSGVEMLGTIPIHWETRQVRFLLKEGAEGIKIGPFGSALKLEDMIDNGIRVYGQENVIKKDFTLGKRQISALKFLEMQVYEIHPLDLLITMMGTSGKCEIVPEDVEQGIIDSHLLRLRVKEKKILPRFFRLLIDECHEIKSQIEVNGKGSIMHGLNSSIVKALILPLPSKIEQANILEFINHETAKIDTLIEKQQQLIQLLKEKRQAVISHAVTKGLNPDVPMRDSGVEWLGEVPEHWVQTPIKHLLNGIIDTEHKTAPFFEDGEYLVVRTTNIKNGKLVLDGAKYTDRSGFIEWTKRHVPNPGDILFTREAPAGEACLVPEDTKLCIGQRTVTMKVNHALLNSRFGLWSLYGGVSAKFISDLSQGSTVAHFNMSDIGNIPIIVPSLNEQTSIANFLDSEATKLELLTTRAQQVINLLQERRTALISAAVTGKIDVRNWQPPKTTTSEAA